MLRAHRVVSSFSAKQLRPGELYVESFDVGELLVVLSSDDGHTTFCRRVDPADLNVRPRFTISNERFALFTEA